MSYDLLLITLTIALLDWVAVIKKWKMVEYVAKPGVMIFLLMWLWTSTGFSNGLIWFGLGIFFSLWGDIFLMLEREQFILGLISFLLTHVAYLIGLNLIQPPINLASSILVIIILIIGIQIYQRISNGLSRSGNKALKIPVLIYTCVIGLMLLSALLTLVRVEWESCPALLVSSGALLFFISDTLLAWNKFVTPLRHGPIIVIMTYHIGQICITLGVAQHFFLSI